MLLPLGGVEAGYKGFGLAMIIALQLPAHSAVRRWART